MPAVVVSAVNTGTDTITATAHGLLTGDRFRLRNVGGALPAATPSLAGATDYFALRVDADNLKICDTNAHALASTGIFDITGSGSGTTTVEFGLPYCIPTALAAAGTQVKSVDANGTWASLVALYDLLTGQAQSVFSGVTLAGNLAVGGASAVTGNETVGGTLGVTGLITASNGVTAGANKDVTLSGTGNVKHGTWTKVLVPNANANGNTFITIDSSTIFGWCVMLDQHLQAGDVITAIRVNVTDNATGPTRASAKFRRYTDGSGSPADVAGPTATSGTAGTQQQIPFTGLSESIAAGKTHLVQVLPSGGAASITLWSIEVDWAR